MKTLAAIVLTIGLAWLTAGWTPWWGIALAAGLSTLLIPRKGKSAFLSGFAGIAIFWAAVALYFNGLNEGLLGNRMAALFGVSSSHILILVSALVGGLIGGMSALTINILRRAIRPEPELH